MDDRDRIERRAVEWGKVIEKLDHLAVDVKEGFSSLECKSNTEKIMEIHNWYEEHKELKKHVLKTVIKICTPTVGAILMVYTAALAYIKG